MSRIDSPAIDGKFLKIEGRRFLVKGTAYGTFAPDPRHGQFPAPDRIAADFQLMAAHGFNTVRTYTPPSMTLLDEAARCGLRVMIGLPWPQHVAFLDDRHLSNEIRHSVREQVRRFAGHPAALLFSIGNEIPAPIVRWHGSRRIEQFLWELYEDAKSAAPDALLTYVNYPPTDFLDLTFLDVCAFNVFLHREKEMGSYLNRLQTIAGHRPLLLAEVGADSIRQGLEGQREIAAMQVRTALAKGACGAVVFAWTDEWWRGGSPVDDWAFGLVDAQRRTTKPALEAVAHTFADAPFSREVRADWPKVTVAVCAYNAADTIEECLTSIAALTYPDVEVVVVNDGSRDGTGDMARGFPGVRVIDIPNGGLSAARNVALQHATGDVIAYTDADVRVDPDWLTFLVQPFLHTHAAAAGGPNIVPADDPWMAQCVARSPGGPTHVLINDHIAEHIPGCNMAFKRHVLLELGGFNPVFVRAGDDVDVCWRLQRKGYRIAFAPAALVWHRHRSSVRGYWKQQVGYGEGEGWLIDRHPEKFLGDRPLWRGRIYSPIPFVRSLWPEHVHTGRWGTALFPSVYKKAVHPWAYLPHRFRWQALSLLLLVAGGLVAGLANAVLGALLMLAGAAGLVTTVVRCLSFASRSELDRLPRIAGLPQRFNRAAYALVIGFLHYLQPFARAVGRLRAARAPGGTLLRIRGRRSPSPSPSLTDVSATIRLLAGATQEQRFWSESWLGVDRLLSDISGRLLAAPAFRTIEVDDGWHADRDIRMGIPAVGALDLRVVIEEHEAGRCLARVATRLSLASTTAAFPLGAAALAAAVGALTGLWGLWLGLMTLFVLLLGLALIVWRSAGAVGAIQRILLEMSKELGLYPLGDSVGRPERDAEDDGGMAPGRSQRIPVAGHEQRHEV